MEGLLWNPVILTPWRLPKLGSSLAWVVSAPLTWWMDVTDSGFCGNQFCSVCKTHENQYSQWGTGWRHPFYWPPLTLDSGFESLDPYRQLYESPSFSLRSRKTTVTVTARASSPPPGEDYYLCETNLQLPYSLPAFQGIARHSQKWLERRNVSLRTRCTWGTGLPAIYFVLNYKTILFF